MHVGEIAAMLLGKRHDMVRALLLHRGINLRRHVTAAELLGERDHAEWDRHPALYPRLRILPRRIALDAHQLGRAAADVEQDRATSSGGDQWRAAEHGERSLGLAVDHLELDPGLGPAAG